MNTIQRFLVVLGTLSMLVVAMPARAQEVTQMPKNTVQAVGVEGGFESAFIARAIYTRRVDIDFVPDARLYGRFTLPVVRPDFGDWAIDGGLRTTPLAWSDLRLAILAGPITRHTENKVFTATAIGLDATILAGYEGPDWGLSAELGYEQILATHIKNTDLYKRTIYPDAKDGWYSITASTAHAGLRGGARFGRVEIGLRAGVQATGHFQPLMPPFYATLGGAYSF